MKCISLLLSEYDGTVRLLEIAQVSDEHSEEFKSGKGACLPD